MAFVVIGAARSGTSLLTALLDAHPQLAMASEMFQRDILLGEDPAWGARRPGERFAGFMEACDEEARRHPGLRWGNKITTEPLVYGGAADRHRGVPALEELVSRFPLIPVLFVLRDGRAVVRSKMTRGTVPLENACRQWCTAVSLMVAFERGRQPTLTVRYEDLVRNPEATLSLACRHLGQEFEPAMLAATSSSPLLLPEYRQPTVQSWRADSFDAPPGCLELIHDDLVRCGYVDAEDESDPAAVSR